MMAEKHLLCLFLLPVVVVYSVHVFVGLNRHASSCYCNIFDLVLSGGHPYSN